MILPRYRVRCGVGELMRTPWPPALRVIDQYVDDSRPPRQDHLQNDPTMLLGRVVCQPEKRKVGSSTLPLTTSQMASCKLVTS